MDNFKITVKARKTARNYLYDFVANLDNKDAEGAIKVGSGVSISKEIAKKKAIFEAIERYYSSKNHNNSKKSENGIFLDKNNKVFLPTSCVCINNKKKKGELDFENNKVSSCGVAIQKSLALATTQGILELVERDAAIKAWLYKKQIPKIDVDTINNCNIKKLIAGIKKEKLVPIVFLSTADVSIPSTIAMVYDPLENVPMVSFGLSASFDLKDAIEKSLCEALMVRSTLEILKSEKKLKKTSKNKIKCFLEHMIFYAFPENKKYWDFLLKSPTLKINEIYKKYNFLKKQSLKNLVRYFSDKRMNIIRIDLGDKLLLDHGLYVVRMIIPELYSMFSGHKNYLLKIKKRYKGRINNDPHPFG